MRLLKVLYIFTVLITFHYLLIHCEYHIINGKKEYYVQRGIQFGIEGKFQEAQTEFLTALTFDSLDNNLILTLEIIEDVLNQRIRRETAIHTFRSVNYLSKNELDKALVELFDCF